MYYANKWVSVTVVEVRDQTQAEMVKNKDYKHTKQKPMGFEQQHRGITHLDLTGTTTDQRRLKTTLDINYY